MHYICKALFEYNFYKISLQNQSNLIQNNYENQNFSNGLFGHLFAQILRPKPLRN